MSVHPALATDVTTAVARANRKAFANSGQVAVLTAVALVQIRNQANGAAWGAFRSDVVAVTGLSESTVRNHIKFWVQRGVLAASSASIIDSWVVVVED